MKSLRKSLLVSYELTSLLNAIHTKLKSKYTHLYDYQYAKDIFEDPGLIKGWFNCEETVQKYGIPKQHIGYQGYR